MTAIICEYCSHETKYHSYNIDSFTGKKFDIYFCNKCLIAKTNLDKNFDLTHYYPKNYYGNEGKRFNVLFEYLVLFARYLRSFFCYRLFFKKDVKLLDVGCGRGQFIYLLKKKGLTLNGAKKLLNNKRIDSLDQIEDLGLYSSGLKTPKNIKDRLKKISKLINEIKNLK